jgi:hypothetical protein
MVGFDMDHDSAPDPDPAASPALPGPLVDPAESDYRTLHTDLLGDLEVPGGAGRGAELCFTMLIEEGRLPVVHVIITGGPGMLDTMKGLSSILEDFPASVRIVVWLNEFFGPVANANGKGFEICPSTRTTARASSPSSGYRSSATKPPPTCGT